MCLLVSSSLLIYAIIKRRGGELENRVTKFFGGVSMEIYLSHMVIFRVVEKIGINRWFGNGWLQYVITVVTVFCGVTVFAVVMKKIIAKTEDNAYTSDMDFYGRSKLSKLTYQFKTIYCTKTKKELCLMPDDIWLDVCHLNNIDY